MPSGTRSQYIQELKELEHDVLEMASRAEGMVGASIEAIQNLDVEAAMRVMREDDLIDAANTEIEMRCLNLLALQQPMAADLRTVSSVLKTITDIERIGDLAVDISKAVLKIEKEGGQVSYVDFQHLSQPARQMLRLSLQAFVKKDPELLTEVGKLESIVDERYREARDQIHDHMRNTPDDVVSASWLILVVKHIERIADHGLNIAEKIHYILTGRHEDLENPTPPEPEQSEDSSSDVNIDPKETDTD